MLEALIRYIVGMFVTSNIVLERSKTALETISEGSQGQGSLKGK